MFLPDPVHDSILFLNSGSYLGSQLHPHIESFDSEESTAESDIESLESDEDIEELNNACK